MSKITGLYPRKSGFGEYSNQVMTMPTTITPRQPRRAADKANTRWPVGGVDIPRDQWPAHGPSLRRVIRSRDYLIQVFDEPHAICRLSVNRTKWLGTIRASDGLSWDELQAIKRMAGYGGRWAVEIYPADDEVVNVAAMRHMWVLAGRPAFAWHR